MHRAGFESATPATTWPQTYALDRAVTGIGSLTLLETFNLYYLPQDTKY